MAKIKHTKTELKAQTDALSRFAHFLPMLQLKKQQLQAEIANVDGMIAKVQRRMEEIFAGLESWVGLLADPELKLEELLRPRGIDTETGNIAGVSVPVYKGLRLDPVTPDLFASEPWVDDAMQALSGLAACRAEIFVLREERRLIGEELRVTSQRVNLFEKVKIPECRENIRVIRIFLGDEQTAAVARGKMAKRRTELRREKDSAA